MSAGTMKVPASSPSGNRTLSFAAKIAHKGAKRFPISRSSNDLD